MTTAFVRSFFVYIDFHTNSTWLGAYDKRFLVVPIGTLGSVAFLLAVPSIKDILIGTTNSGISYLLRDIYSICRCYWNIASYKWKIHNGKIEIISFVVKFGF